MITLFLEKPSRRDYPDYYKLISDPIDMRMIDKKVRSDKYVSVEEMLEDFRLMFNNARQYNEPGSEVCLLHLGPFLSNAILVVRSIWTLTLWTKSSMKRSGHLDQSTKPLKMSMIKAYLK